MKQKKGESNKYSYNSTKRQRLVKSVVKSFINSAILDRQVDPRGKDEQEMNKELISLVKYIKKNDISIEFFTDHRESILKEGRRYRNLKKSEFASVFYGIWFEHWINNLIAVYGTRNKLSSEEIIQIIRDSNVRSKFSWVRKLLGIPNIPAKHINAVIHLFDIRNAFVHYKWKGYLSLINNNQQEEMDTVLNQIEETINYFKSYENKHLYHNSRKKVNKIIKSKPNPPLKTDRRNG